MTMKLALNSENYHSQEANREYFSVSQFKSMMQCEATEIAKLNGEYIEPYSNALTVGSYTHAAFESDAAFNNFCEQEHDAIFKNRGGKYADFEQADRMIETLKSDDFAMFALSGEKEQIFTGHLFGADWKVKVDNINLQQGFFSDLKTTQSLSKRFWNDKYQKYVSFVESFDYVLQMAIYREIIKQSTGYELTPYIVAVTKENPPDKAILHFDESRFNFELEYVETYLPSMLKTKQGLATPIRCEKCAYCRATKKLSSTYEIGFLLDE
ncbi:PD-(D/E)XK nuclease-like domain-containing protein [Rummeliibacillus sp. TYF-LIM-RU47]|uniref:PD-(D/E)XK nuclease-like domain-containing protein n=1 Tax=Rummeliibacillus sp. TYF-LIM-RU47 TaxID=2608406 RepID=UPI001CC23C53|nr:PD-(D/E)XK nuclease-like domain-containing protein [Rummeliibacillus sp. TYF-LIM-RU47]